MTSDTTNMMSDVDNAGRRTWSTSVVLLSLGWLVVAGIGVAYGLLLWDMGDLRCPVTPDASTYGEAGWSLLPPGPTCTFTADVHGFDEVRGPYPVMSMWLMVLVVGVLAIVWVKRRARARQA